MTITILQQTPSQYGAVDETSIPALVAALRDGCPIKARHWHESRHEMRASPALFGSDDHQRHHDIIARSCRGSSLLELMKSQVQYLRFETALASFSIYYY